MEKYINKNFLDMFIRTKNKRIKIEIININGEKIISNNYAAADLINSNYLI